jgi:hypothetical protein
LYIHYEAANTSLPALTTVGGDLWMFAPGPSLPILEWVGGYLVINYDAENASLPSLEEVGGPIFNPPKTDLPALRTAA